MGAKGMYLLFRELPLDLPRYVLHYRMLPRTGMESHPFPCLRKHCSWGEYPPEGAMHGSILRSKEHLADSLQGC